MFSLKKSIGRAFVFLQVFLLAGVSAYALPKVTPFIPDGSGEYVYYRDYTFSNESYMGFVYYDDSTYAARFYSPAASGQTEKDITVYLNVDPNADYMSFTGDKIVGIKSEEDTDIVNYIYDVMIELTKLRQKVTVKSATDTTQSAKLELFNGDIRLAYNPVVPLFNIRNISKADGSYLWNLVTVGCLSNSEDKTFADFKGFSPTLKDLDRKTKIKSAKAYTAEMLNQSVVIDGNWTNPMYNIWLMGDYAMIMLSELLIPEQNADMNKIFYNRAINYSTEDNYVTWHTMTNKTEGNRTVTTSLNVQPSTGDVIRTIRVSVENGNKIYVMMISVFDGVYQKNKKYFDGIVASYKIK